MVLNLIITKSFSFKPGRFCKKNGDPLKFIIKIKLINKKRGNTKINKNAEKMVSKKILNTFLYI
jgi:hypothetical protein